MHDEQVEKFDDVEDATQRSGSLFGGCLAVRPPGPGVCAVCCGASRGPFELCHSCRRVSRGLPGHLRPVTPVSLTERGTALYSALKRYKGRPNLLSRRQQVRLADLLATFVELHARCVASDGFDPVCVVPSRQIDIDDPDEDPLTATIGMVPALASLLVPALSAGSGRIARNAPCADVYRCAPDLVEGRRVLLVDDTYTTGAHMQSAASAIELAGAASVELLVLARYQNRAWPPARRLLEWAARPENSWEPASCVRCRGDVPPPRKPQPRAARLVSAPDVVNARPDDEIRSTSGGPE